ncbi:hypothetical protein [Marinomonas algicola]|uniref:hypothetical protein n=1 Tax=Marinomonas algicola TaxID=2773454 RepID=UPI00174C48A2|nr:hypothetical protein [Marinomonas algicola]
MTIQELQKKACAAATDREFFNLISHLKIDDLISFFDGTEEFFIHSEDPGLSRQAKRSKRVAYYRSHERRIKSELDKNGYGSIYSNAKKDRFGLVHPSTSETPRITFFDEFGFSSHTDCTCLNNVVENLKQSGLYFHSPDIDMIVCS